MAKIKKKKLKVKSKPVAEDSIEPPINTRKSSGMSNKRKIEYGLIIAIVVGSFFISYGIRAQPLQYGMEIDEFDPYFNYRASLYLHENGLEAYKNWHDDMSWYPTGRDVYDTSQVMLHVTAVTLYQPFADHMTLKEFVIYFPAVIGSLTVIPIFLLVNRLTNMRIAALATIFFAVSVPFIQRGMAGWYKSEPLGMFYGIFGIYFFVSGVMNVFENKKTIGIAKLVASGIVLGLGLSSWGGIAFFFLPLVIWCFTIPAFKDKLVKGLGIGQSVNEDGTMNLIKEYVGYNFKSFVIGLGGFAGGLILVSSMFARSSSLVGNYIGLAVAVAIGFIIIEHIMNKRFNWSYKKTLVIFIGIIVIGGVIGSDTTISTAVATSTNADWFRGCDATNMEANAKTCKIVNIPVDRYMRVLVPISDSTTLSKSVAEHQIPEFSHIFARTVFLFIFTPIGFVAIARKAIPALPASFAVIISGMAMYIGMSYVRLELFMSLGMIIMGSLGIYFLLQKFAEQNNGITKSASQLKKRKIRGYVIMAFLLGTMMVPTAINWAIMMDRPALILYGASVSPEPHNDWLETLEWIKNNTSEDAKIMSWWDYGYWIQTMGNRTTYMDNAAHMPDRIIENAQILTNPPNIAVRQLMEKEADYVVIYVVGEKIEDYVRLGLGGDVGKMWWILGIADENNRVKYYDDYGILNNDFYYNTLYGSMIPFVHRAEYIDQSKQPMDIGHRAIAPWESDVNNREEINPMTGQRYDYGWMKFELKDTGGLRMVYASEGITNPPKQGLFHGVFVYEVPKLMINE